MTILALAVVLIVGLVVGLTVGWAAARFRRAAAGLPQQTRATVIDAITRSYR